MTKILIFFIDLYQKTLSPDHGWMKSKHPHGYCKYYPSCSEYTRQSLKKYGAFIGLYMGFKRILKCNPWSQGGIDLA
jgi:putative membrane protein insertion efficiency factor